jgi:hypothetical protein
VSLLTIERREVPKQTTETRAAKGVQWVGQFLAWAAGEKLAVVLTLEYLRREDFEKGLASVPDRAPPENDRLD